MGEIVINQHYIPQCVLNYFCNEKEQVFECLVDTKRIYITNIRNSMSERYTYEHPYFETNRIEKWLSRIEDFMAPAIQNMTNTIDSCIKGVSSFSDIRKLVNWYLPTFLIFYYRSGALLHEFSTGRNDKHDRILLMTEKLMNSSYIRALGKSIIQNYNFAIVCNPAGRFLMSDQFISTAALSIKNRFYQISNRHMGLKDTMILIPISKNYYAVYHHGDFPIYIRPNRVNILQEVQVDEINSAIINNSYGKCISYSKEAIKEALKSYKFSSATGFFAGGPDDALSYASTLKKEVFFYNRDNEAWKFITSYYKWDNYFDINRNDKCPCGRGKKFKNCCMRPLEIAARIISHFIIAQKFPFAPVDRLKDIISIYTVLEQPIDEFVNRKKQE